MDILLTGASGFLGKNFLSTISDDDRVLAIYCRDGGFPDFVSRLKKWNITAVRCELSNKAEVEVMLSDHGREWEYCLYLAVNVDIPWSVHEPREDLLANTGSLLNLLEGIRARRLVYFSSGAVYDGSTGEMSPGAQVSPTLPYAISKLACERYTEFY
jgi:UDP-glucose 4-epimerase